VTAAPSERLTGEVRRLIAGNTLSAFGTGFTLPFLFIYLTDVRHMAAGTAGTAIATLGVVGLLTVPFTGWLSDRIGPWRVLVLSMLVEAVGTAGIALVTRPWHAFAVLSFVGVGMAAGWPAQSALIASLVPPEHRSRVYAVQFTLLNLGIGVGGAVSGLLVDVSRVGSFQAIYVVDAFSFVGYAAILATIRHVSVRPPPPAPGEASGGYRDLLRDRVFLRLCAVVLLMSIAGYGQINSGFPGFVRRYGHVSTRAIGLAFAANTAVIVLVQLGVERRLQGRRRTRALAGVAVVWMASWAVIGSAGLVHGTLAAGSVIAGLALFGLGETLWAPTGNTLVNDIAPAHLRGRYNAVASISWQLSSVIGPALAGLALQSGRPGAYIGGLLLALGVAAVLFVGMERRLTPFQNGLRPDGDAPPGAEPAAPAAPGQPEQVVPLA
jgi:MFS family permease